jgi:hypothetical protein
VKQLLVVSSQLSVADKRGGKLALTLFVLGVFADNANDTTAMNDLAFIADLLD